MGWKLTAEVESDFEWSTYNLTEVDVANVHDLVTILVGTLSDDEQETVYRDATDLPRPREDLEWNRPEYKPEQCRKVEVYEMIEVIDEGTYGTGELSLLYMKKGMIDLHCHDIMLNVPPPWLFIYDTPSWSHELRYRIPVDDGLTVFIRLHLSQYG